MNPLDAAECIEKQAGGDVVARVAEFEATFAGQDTLRTEQLRAHSGGTPAHLYEDISGFANCDGGVLVFGVDERRGFEVVGVADAQRLQSDIATNAAQLSPQPVVAVSRHLVEGREVVVAEVDALPPSRRPAHLKSKDETHAWVRVGNSTQRSLPAVHAGGDPGGPRCCP